MEKLEIGKVLKPQGIKGEVKVELYTSDSEYIKSLKVIFIDEKAFDVNSIRIQDKYAYICIDNVFDRNQAETLRNKVIYGERVDSDISEYEFYISDLEDCCVVDEDDLIIGYVESVEKYSSTPIINILLGGGIKSFPFIKKVLKSVDIKNKKIIVYKNKLKEVLI